MVLGTVTENLELSASLLAIHLLNSSIAQMMRFSRHSDHHHFSCSVFWLLVELPCGTMLLIVRFSLTNLSIRIYWIVDFQLYWPSVYHSLTISFIIWGSFNSTVCKYIVIMICSICLLLFVLRCRHWPHTFSIIFTTSCQSCSHCMRC